MTALPFRSKVLEATYDDRWSIRPMIVPGHAAQSDSLLVGEAEINECQPFRAGLVAEFSSTLRAPQNLAPPGQMVHSVCILDRNELALARFVGEKITVSHNGASISLSLRAESRKRQFVTKPEQQA